MRGEIRVGFFGREMVHPSFRKVDVDTPLSTSLTPVYPTSAQLPQAYLRKAVASALRRAPLDEVLPLALVPGTPALRDALNFLHHPPPSAGLSTLEDHTHPAWQRLKFEELLAQQLSQQRAQRERAHLRAPPLRGRPGGLHERLLAALPFALTGAQHRVAEEVAADLARPQPMHRLLQGDVGSGKTVVAALAAAVAIDAGWQCALMAPTEILAEQHFRKLIGWLEPLGIRVAWITGSIKGKARQKMLDAAASRRGHADRRHARGDRGQGALPPAGAGRSSTSSTASASRSGWRCARSLADEATGAAGAGASGSSPLEPHLLMMSATPIPRTLAMTYFADLDVSTIDELPPGRSPIVTRVFADSRRDDVIEKIAAAVEDGRQVYWVCPLIEESEALDLQERHRDACRTRGRAAGEDGRTAARPHAVGGEGRGDVAVQRRADADPRRDDRHRGRRRRAQRQRDGHRTRGALRPVAAAPAARPRGARIGRQRVRPDLHRAARTPASRACARWPRPSDGFEIARRDLDIRGPGEFMGARQSGAQLLRFADLQEDAPLLSAARALAPRLLDEQPRARAAAGRAVARSQDRVPQGLIAQRRIAQGRITSAWMAQYSRTSVAGVSAPL